MRRSVAGEVAGKVSAKVSKGRLDPKDNAKAKEEKAEPGHLNQTRTLFIWFVFSFLVFLKVFT